MSAEWVLAVQFSHHKRVLRRAPALLSLPLPVPPLPRCLLRKIFDFGEVENSEPRVPRLPSFTEKSLAAVPGVGVG
jgi:hypothetical protein